MHAMTLLKGACYGAACMYFFDPQIGRRRRKLLADQYQHWARKLNAACDVTCRDASNRVRGTIAELQSRLREHDNSDPVVCSRVRSKLGRYVSHPSAIEVQVNDGRVFLSGPILAHEVEPLIHRVKTIIGVRSVVNHLDVHESPGSISALQGGRPRQGERPDIFQENWSPTTRCMVGTLGGVLLLSCMKSRGLKSLLHGAGAALLISKAMHGGCGKMHASADAQRQQWLSAGPQQPESPESTLTGR